MKILNLKSMLILIILLVLITGFISVSTATALANSSSNVDLIINTGVLSSEKAMLISDNGTEYMVNMFEMPEKLLSEDLSTNTKSYMKEYAVVLDKNNIIQIAGTQTNTAWDVTGGVKGTVTFYYDQQEMTYTRFVGHTVVR